MDGQAALERRAKCQQHRTNFNNLPLLRTNFIVFGETEEYRIYSQKQNCIRLLPIQE